MDHLCLHHFRSPGLSLASLIPRRLLRRLRAGSAQSKSHPGQEVPTYAVTMQKSAAAQACAGSAEAPRRLMEARTGVLGDGCSSRLTQWGMKYIYKGLRPHAADPHASTCNQNIAIFSATNNTNGLSLGSIRSRQVPKRDQKDFQSGPFGASKSAKMSTGSDRRRSQAS